MPTPTNISVHMCNYCHVDPTELPTTEPAASEAFGSYRLATMLVEQSADEVTMYIMPHAADCQCLKLVTEAQ